MQRLLLSMCGICASRCFAADSGEVEHRDFVLSRAERRERVILCCSRTRDAGAELIVDL